jgi:predicted DNA binding CopG/RHH family protein
MPKFKTEKQEADWLYAHRRKIEADMRKEKRTKTPTVAQIVERERTKPISIRLAVGDIDRAKEQARAKGIGYQTLIRMLVHDALSSVRKTG